MEWGELTPWITISITLAISILVPLFTQIANNCHQRKMQKDTFRHEENQARTYAFEMFPSDVGGVITAKGHVEKESLFQAGAALHKLYVYAPSEWFDDLDLLTKYIMEYKWEEARLRIQKLSCLISCELPKKL